jgi:uracil-DNA glycosylase family 4
MCARKRLKKHIGVAFSNTIRDNPDDNRVPTQQELDMCLSYLYRDIATLKERGLKVVMPLGNAAKGALIVGGTGAISKDRGQVFKVSHAVFGDILMIPTYHPSYIMRNVPVFDETKESPLDEMVVNDIMLAYAVGVTVDRLLAKPAIQIESESLF